MAKKRRPSKELAVDLPEMIPQPHGGALYSRGVLGHKGGSGRPPSVVKEMAEEATIEILPRLKQIAMGRPMKSIVRKKGKKGQPDMYMEIEATPELRDQLRAMDQLAKLALPRVMKASAGEFNLEDGIVVIKSTLVLGEDHGDD